MSIKSEQLSHKYKGQKSKIGFPDINLADQEHLLILGRSGVGKTTLLHLFGGILPVKHGKLSVGDQELSLLNSSQLDTFRAANIGIVFQKHHFVKAISVLENLLLTQSIAGNKANKEYALDLLARLNIADKANQLPSTLSEGEKQRVSIARAIINKPKLILADEPTSALDRDNCDQVIKMLLEQAQENDAHLIVVTHDDRLKEVFNNQIVLS